MGYFGFFLELCYQGEGSEVISQCGGVDVLRVIKFIWQLLDIVFIVVPIGLILMVSIDFAKNVIAGREDDMKKNLSLVIKRLIFCVALFLVNPIVSFTIDLLGEYGVDYLQCITQANEMTAEELDYYEESSYYCDVYVPDET